MGVWKVKKTITCPACGKQRYFTKRKDRYCSNRCAATVVTKTCAACGVKHNKAGRFCSHKCANVRVVSEDQKIRVAIKRREQMLEDTDKAEEARWSINRHKGIALDFPDPNKVDIGVNQFVAGGDVWTEE